MVARDGFESITGTSDSCKYRQELTSTGDVITTVSSNPGAIGYASLAAVKDTVKKVSVDGVEATEETVRMVLIRYSVHSFLLQRMVLNYQRQHRHSSIM